MLAASTLVLDTLKLCAECFEGHIDCLLESICGLVGDRIRSTGNSEGNDDLFVVGSLRLDHTQTHISSHDHRIAMFEFCHFFGYERVELLCSFKMDCIDCKIHKVLRSLFIFGGTWMCLLIILLYVAITQMRVDLRRGETLVSKQFPH